MQTKLLPLALLAAAPAGAAEPEVVLPAWMAGCWIEQTAETWAEECWTAPRLGMMMGSSRSGNAQRTTSWEFMRIVAGQPNGEGAAVRLAYLAAPQGNNWTMFAWSPDAGQGVTFISAAHDYPQRIRYWREGKSLLAEISMADGSKARRWTYVRQGG